MKEKDLKKCLDNLIIKGLIQEAEQDNADFEVAMRNMSDEDFLALIYDTVEEPITAASNNIDREILIKDTVAFAASPSPILLENTNLAYDEWDVPEPKNKPESSKNTQKVWKIWAAAIATVAAILLIVFVPAHMDMNLRLCDSALLASEAYTRGADIPSMQKNDIEAMLPELERQYCISIEKSKGIQREQIQEKDDTEYYIENVSPREAGIDLVQAYLKLGMKDKAVKVLHELETNDDDPEFKEFCQKMLEILE